MQHVLVIEDCPDAFQLIQLAIGSLAVITWARSASEAKELASKSNFDLIMLDLMLPDGCGYEICKAFQCHETLRAVPVVMLTARNTAEDKIKGFEVGVDHYITKPFNPRELRARLENLLLKFKRRPLTDLVSAAGVTIDKNMQQVIIKNERIDLTPTEFKILMLLVSEFGNTVERDTLSDKVWGNLPTSVRQVDTQISKLRKKIGADKIQSIHGIGYRMA